MDHPIVHPGLVSHELLTLQAAHRSLRIWNGELLSQNIHLRCIDDFWDLIRDHPLYQCTIACLTRTGFYRVIEVGRLPFNCPLITNLIELWRPEIHIFHLPIGEAIITLQDVEVLFGLPVDDLVVHYPPAIRKYRRLDYIQLLERLTGFHPIEESTISGVSRLRLLPVSQHLETLHE
uniref:Serine/threonine-protein phosphatase 7 long form homolog n=1 Tax=Nicotiana tabacum TaxID=4097 RepID=A0A1S3XQF1_TOBAC|nr:PREDICTED: serine/threonine-protein phosphatase 7 long form homolog [Nicotiana tabacum]